MSASVARRFINRSRLLIAIAAALLVVPTIGATASAAAPKTPTPAHSRAEVKTDWVAFFNAKTKTARRIQLLQNGQQFASIIRAASRSPLAAGVSGSVSKVALTSSTRARVTYSILDQGAAVLPDQSGTAIYQGGLWKVGDSSFCSLLNLEEGGKTSSLPSACRPGK